MSHNPASVFPPPDSATHTVQGTVSILVPIYNSLPAVMRCLGSLYQSIDPNRMEILATDDYSPEYNILEQPLPTGIRLLRNEQNLGFAGNVNNAALHAEGEYLLIVNQDTRATPLASDSETVKRLLKPGWIDALLAVFEAYPDAGIVGPRLVFRDGALQSAGGLFDGGKGPFHRFLGWSNPEDRRISVTERVAWITGAAIMIRRADFLALGGLDGDTYKMGYFEDVDLCMKMRFQMGKQVYYCPDATLIHEVGSTGGNPYFMENSRKFHLRWDAAIVPDTQFVHVNY